LNENHKITTFATCYVIHNGKKEIVLKHKHNSRTDTGASALYTLMTSGGTDAPIYIALASSAQTITKDMTSLTNEISGNGLTRTNGTVSGYTAPTALDGAASYSLSKTFVYSGSEPINIYALGVFDKDSNGNLYYVWNLDVPKTLTQTDQFVVNIQVNF